VATTSGWVRRYLHRLGTDDPGRPSAEALFAIHRAQTERVAYETIDIFLGRPQGINPAESIERIIRGRGGYCFNLNGALATLLEALGYDVRWHVGAVHSAGSDPSPGEYRNHLAVTVELDGETWMIDAGLGDAHHEPMPLRPGDHRQGPFTFGLAPIPRVPCGWRFTHDPALNHSWSEMDFTLGRAHWTDFTARHAELSTDPGSPFVRVSQLHRRDERGADSLIGCVLQRVEAVDNRTERALTTRADWFGAAADVFGLRLDDLTADDRDRLWQRLHASHQAWLAERDGEAKAS
jgi:N-hydroxyarylamine O-acetyltransferase